LKSSSASLSSSSLTSLQLGGLMIWLVGVLAWFGGFVGLVGG
jgi:hypothetical protein